MAFNTGNPIGSTSPKDLSDNARNFDLLALGDNPEYSDRKGVPRKSWKGMEGEHNASQIRHESEFTEFLRSSGYETPIEYAPGIIISRPTQQVRYLNELYRPKDSVIPFITTTFNADQAKWISNGENSLRQQLADPKGAEAIFDKFGPIERAARSLHAINADRLNLKSYGAIGDGAPHPLSERYPTLSSAQSDYPHVTSLADQIDWAATQGALNERSSKGSSGYIGGGMVWAPNGSYVLNKKILVPEKCGIEGEHPIGSRFKLLDGANLGTDGIFENKNKTGIGQEWFFLENLNIDGNKAGGTTAGANIKTFQIYVNSFMNNLVVGNSPGHAIWLLSTPDGIAPGDGGPIEIKNCWLRVPNGHCLFVDGDFSEVNTYGGAFENPAAGFDCIHIDGAAYAGVRANVCLHSPHFEYSNAGSKGIYARLATGLITNLTSIGSQKDDQYNVYIDRNCNLTIAGYKQSVGIRKGIYFADTGREYTATYGGIIGNDVAISDRGHTANGIVGSDVAVDCVFNDVLSLSANSPTSIANFINTSGPKLVMRFSNGNYTLRNNANIRLKPASDYSVPAGAIMEFFRIGNLWYESGRY